MRHRDNQLLTRLMLVALLLAAICGAPSPSVNAQDELVLVVMDPLSAPLACICIEGYAQRKYEALGDHLATSLQRPVRVVWGGAIDVATKEVNGRAHVIIGKRSVVEHDAAKLRLKITPLASLSGMDGRITQTGLIVVRRDDPARSVADLQGYRVFFGPPECEEKSAAPMRLLREHGVEVPEEAVRETCGACGEAVAKLMELDPSVRAAAVISSYAQPLLVGCGNIQEGDFRVVGESEPVPFVTVFVNEDLHEGLIEQIRQALWTVRDDPLLCMALETVAGFVPCDTTHRAEPSKKK